MFDGVGKLDSAEMAQTAATAGGLGLIGRLVYWAAHQDKHPVGWSLLWELPLALGMGYIGISISEYLHLSQNQTYGATICVSYVGPRIIDLALLRISAKSAP